VLGHHRQVPRPGKVLLLTGPIGSGKSTLAQYLAERLGWECLSEDAYWLKNGWGSVLRSTEQEELVQRQVLRDVLTICRSGQSVVLEFILFSEPPNPLSAYERALADHLVAVEVVVLKPSVPEILRRIATRGRTRDLQDLAARRRDVEHQIRILESGAMSTRRIIDTTDLSVSETYQACLQSLAKRASPDSRTTTPSSSSQPRDS
jgi:deoxyadenosine/deoxycytidine kinase